MAMQRTFKEIIKETNQEFVKELKTHLALVSAIVTLILMVAFVGVAFHFNVLLGLGSLPVAFFGGFWCIKLINNVFYYWRL